MTAPTIEEQYLLELINEARLNPAASAERYIASYNLLSATQLNIQQALGYFGVSGSALAASLASQAPSGPLAWSDQLSTAAEKHGNAMIAADEQSHQLPGEASLATRATAEGYIYSYLGENVYAYADDVLFAHAGFMADWGYDAVDYSNGNLNPDFATTGDGIQDQAGHLANIMNPNYREAGIDVAHETSSATEVGPLVVTEDFGSSGAYFVTGVAYTDKDKDAFYSYGEGRGDLTVKIGTTSVKSYASGGYTLQAPTGLIDVVLSGGGLKSAVTVHTMIVRQNVKLDVVDGNTLLTSASVNVEGSAITVLKALGTIGLELTAGTGAQTIYGTAAADVLSGGAGNDVLIGGLGDDRLIGGEGTDIAEFVGYERDFSYGTDENGKGFFYSRTSGNDYVEGIEIYRFLDGDFFISADGILTVVDNSTGGSTTGFNVIKGTSKADTLTGTERDDLFIGGAGNDVINGGDSTDISSYSDASQYYIVGDRGSSIVVIGPDGSDTLNDVEIMRFTDGDFVLRDGLLVPLKKVELNNDPDTAPSQNLSTNKNASLDINVLASDPDGDRLSFEAGQGLHGAVVSQGSGAFVYTPTANYTGTDSFKVTVRDGQGGVGFQTVNIVIAEARVPSDPPPPQNQAPQVQSNQLATTTENKAVAIKVQATDPDGDAMTFTAKAAAHGVVTGGVNGAFTYTPTAGYSGFDSFDVKVSDGKGGEANLTVTILIEDVPDVPVNHAPVVNPSQTVILDDDGKASITVSATDPDGDALTFSAGSTAEGSVTGGGNGIFAFTASPGFDGKADFLVTVSDGKGGSAVQTVNVLASLPESQVILSNGFKGTFGGNGKLFGTQTIQDLALDDAPGQIVFDGSFNQGGDILRLSHVAAQYQIHLEGSLAVLSDGDTSYKIPIGTSGLTIVFSDGVRKLVYDAGAQSVKIGSQAITQVPASVTAPSDGTPLPSGVNEQAASLVTLGSNAEITAGGNYAIFGSAGNEQLHYLRGNMTLDPSFNKGGDILHLPGAPSDYTAYYLGSTLVISSALGKITIPVGLNGLELDFGGETRILKIDTTLGKIVIGDQAITATTPETANQLAGGGSGGGGGTEVSLDGYPSNVTTVIELTGGTNYKVTDDANINTNVEIRGFDEDDVLHVTGAGHGDYSFTSLADDSDGVANDLRIEFNDGAHFAQILVKNVLTPGQFVYDEATAEAAAGWNFITFPGDPDESGGGGTGGGGTGGGGIGGGGTGSGELEQSLDGYPASVTTVVELNGGTAYILNDDANINTNVDIRGFDQDDAIHVTGANPGEYSFTSLAADGDGVADDLKIEFNDGAHFAMILVKDVLTPGQFVFDEATAEAAAGWNFITIA